MKVDREVSSRSRAMHGSFNQSRMRLRFLTRWALCASDGTNSSDTTFVLEHMPQKFWLFTLAIEFQSGSSCIYSITSVPNRDIES